MEQFAANFLFFGLLFILVFVVNYFFNRNKVKKKKYKNIGEIAYLISRYQLDEKKIKYSRVIIPIALMNAFIISLVTTVITLIPLHMIFQLLIGFVLLIALIYSIYGIYGQILVRKGFKKQGSERK